MDVKLICMDLDGTALQADRKTFSPRLIAALEAAHARGIAIAPVTGRQYGILPPALKGHPVWEDLVVTCNGGQIYRLGTGERLFGLDIEEPALRQILEIADRLGIAVEYSLDSRLHLTRRSYELQQHDPRLDFHVNTVLANNGVIVESLEPLCTARIEKIMFPLIPSALAKDVERALENVAVSAVWASSCSIEVTHPDANKGNGLHHLCRLLDIPIANALAIGDSGNDASMLRRAGFGIAMGNAPESIKAIADAVTASNSEDGAAIAIETYCL